ncbi:hypothetical protein LMG29739_05647 [Paraburkholderia solisilvae]|uniref:DhaL domain-containing protein n=1 Tax=Paraburkholderia solisilvae TaxID=624376 RepID=A0A6J5EXB3_9BURK|nr:hypothetical protein LMG29739_05647 [Paraburkholderia solisilvae]
MRCDTAPAVGRKIAPDAVATVLDALKKVAEENMFATRDMLAMKGRASFPGERSRGHIDPGAHSSQLMIAAVCAYFVRAA